MYLKVVPRIATGDTIIRPESTDITFGHWSPPSHPNADWSFSDVMRSGQFAAPHSAPPEYLDTEYIDAYQWPDNDVRFRFAWWVQASGRPRLIVTAGDIYLLNDDGKTVDRA